MFTPRHTAARRRLRTAIQWCVYFLLAAGLVQTWLLDGLVVPYRVSGGSMAGTLLGVHRQVVCADCGYAFPCDTDVRPMAPRAVCPNCGCAANDLESSSPDLAGKELTEEVIARAGELACAVARSQRPKVTCRQ